MNEGGCTVRVFKNKGTRRTGFFDLPEFPFALLRVGGGVDTGEWVRGMVMRGFEIHDRRHSEGYILARKPK